MLIKIDMHPGTPNKEKTISLIESSSLFIDKKCFEGVSLIQITRSKSLNSFKILVNR